MKRQHFGNPINVLLVMLSLASAGCAKERQAPFGADAEVAQAKNVNEREADPDQKADAADPRKIIYTANLQLFAENLDKAEKSLIDLVDKHGGYIAESDIQGRTGTQRRGKWKVRIPVEHFEDFRGAVLQLGEPEQNSLSSQEITSDYYDLASRLKNAKQAEQRLRDHLKESTKELKDILEAERELARVRQEIETMEGQLRLWDNLVALTTLHIVIFERRDYVPPQAATFATTMGRTFSNSLDALVNVGKLLVLAGIALVPWLPVIALLAAPLWWLIRRAQAPKGQIVSVQPSSSGPSAEAMP